MADHRDSLSTQVGRLLREAGAAFSADDVPLIRELCGHLEDLHLSADAMPPADLALAFAVLRATQKKPTSARR
jgi:hypothetical protein